MSYDALKNKKEYLSKESLNGWNFLKVIILKIKNKIVQIFCTRPVFFRTFSIVSNALFYFPQEIDYQWFKSLFTQYFLPTTSCEFRYFVKYSFRYLKNSSIFANQFN